MSIEQAFEQRKLVTTKLKEYLRDNGHTKVSFARKSGISRTDLDSLLKNEINDKDVFDGLLKASLLTLDVSLDTILSYSPPPIEPLLSSNKIPGHIKLSIKAQKQYDLLLDILSLCEIYY